MNRRRVRSRPVLRPSLVALATGIALGPLVLGACSSESVPTGAPAATTGGASSSGISSGSSSASSSASLPRTSTGDVATPTPGELLTRAKAAVQQAQSAHIAGTVEDAGASVVLDVAGRNDGSSARGKVKIDGATIEFTLVNGQTYVRGDQKFWAQTGAPAARVAQLAASGKWIKASEAKAQSFPQLATPSKLLSEILNGVTPDPRTQKVQSTVSDGLQCWALRNATGSAAAEFVVLQESFRPVRLVDDKGQTLTITEWNSVQPPKAPAASEIITG